MTNHLQHTSDYPGTVGKGEPSIKNINAKLLSKRVGKPYVKVNSPA